MKNNKYFGKKIRKSVKIDHVIMMDQQTLEQKKHIRPFNIPN